MTSQTGSTPAGPTPSPPDSDVEKKKLVLEAWKKTVDVQQHFNDLALRIRNFALTAFTFIIGAVGYLIKQDFNVTIWNITIPAASLMCFAGILILVAFWYMDRYWYYNLLVGAVNHGTFIEEKYQNELPEIGLTKAISKASPNKLRSLKIRSKYKFWAFYGIIWGTLFLLGLLLWLKHPSEQKNLTQAQTEFQLHTNSHNVSHEVSSTDSTQKKVN